MKTVKVSGTTIETWEVPDECPTEDYCEMMDWLSEREGFGVHGKFLKKTDGHGWGIEEVEQIKEKTGGESGL